MHISDETFEARRQAAEEQYARLRLIPHVPDLIRRSGTLQEYTERAEFVRRRSRGEWAKTMTTVRYYAFIAILHDLRMTVVVKEADGGQKNFHSVFPSWDTEPDGRGGRRKKFCTGDPASD